MCGRGCGRVYVFAFGGVVACVFACYDSVACGDILDAFVDGRRCGCDCGCGYNFDCRVCLSPRSLVAWVLEQVCKEKEAEALAKNIQREMELQVVVVCWLRCGCGCVDGGGGCQRLCAFVFGRGCVVAASVRLLAVVGEVVAAAVALLVAQRW